MDFNDIFPLQTWTGITNNEKGVLQTQIVEK